MSDSKDKPTTSKGKKSTTKGDKTLSSSRSAKETTKDEDEESSDSSGIDVITKFFSQKLSLVNSIIRGNNEPGEKVIEDLSFAGLCDHWRKHGFKNIITMVGAGISTSAGIPDFRSPGTGLYDNLKQYDLPRPTAIFELSFFQKNPKPFFALAKELYPGSFNPTPAHYFIRLLHEKGLLLRHYTQNIDTLDRIAGIPEEKLVEAHGTFYTNHCTDCRKAYSMAWMKEQIFSDVIPVCTVCKSLVKPDIVFFGECLPERFYSQPMKDFQKCDLLIIMGTSLEVQPFASLVDHAGVNCLRLLINRTKISNSRSWFHNGPTFMVGEENNTRDLEYIGDCDDGVFALAKELDWFDELNSLIESERKRLSSENSNTEAASKN